MIVLDTCYSLSMVPYLTYGALEDYAQKIVADFAPERLSVPGVMDVERFLEFYLKMTVDFQRISHNRKILGVTAFDEGTVEIIDEDTGEVVDLFVEAGTVIIDPSLSVKRNLPRLRFTMTHEGCHWLIHQKAFRADNPFGPAGIYANQFLAAKEGRIDYSRTLKERNDIEMMERQADFLSAAILMPKGAVREAYLEYFRMNSERQHRIIRGISPSDDIHTKRLPEYVATTFNVSKRAALIRLEKLTAIVNRGWPYCR